MEKQYVGKWRFKRGIERRLYYGTGKAVFSKICAQDSTEVNAEHAVSFGRRSYFVRDMSRATKKTFLTIVR